MLTFEQGTNVVSQNITSKLSIDTTEHPVEHRSHHQEMMKMQPKFHNCDFEWILFFILEVLKHLRVAIWPKRPEKCINNWILHHDNAVTPPSRYSSFWWRTKFQPSLSHHIPQVSLFVTSWFSQNARLFSKVIFCVCGRNSTEHDSRFHIHAKRGLAYVLPAVAGLL